MAAEGNDSQTLVSSGSALPGIVLAIVDPHTLTPSPPGEIGEIWISSAYNASGYWNRSEETAQTFHAKLADHPGLTFLRSGDLGYLEHGELFVTGRIKDLIVLRGANYYPQDIELTVETSHPAVRPGCVAAFAVPGLETEEVVVVAEVRSGPGTDLSDVIGSLRSVIARAHEVRVSRVCLVPPRIVPKTSSGKIRRAATREAFLTGSLPILAEWGAGATGKELAS